MQILLDGVDTRRLNLQWLRSKMGLVSQEPVLFSGTVAQNIAFGRDQTPDQAEIEAAARTANAHDFISASPGGYSTQVWCPMILPLDTYEGSRGSFLPGANDLSLSIVSRNGVWPAGCMS